MENIVTSKPSTVSLLRGMRLKKCLQNNGLKLDVKNNTLEGRNDKDENEKMTFVRPFEDDYETSGIPFKLCTSRIYSGNLSSIR